MFLVTSAGERWSAWDLGVRGDEHTQVGLRVIPVDSDPREAERSLRQLVLGREALQKAVSLCTVGERLTHFGHLEE